MGYPPVSLLTSQKSVTKALEGFTITFDKGGGAAESKPTPNWKRKVLTNQLKQGYHAQSSGKIKLSTSCVPPFDGILSGLAVERSTRLK